MKRKAIKLIAIFMIIIILPIQIWAKEDPYKAEQIKPTLGEWGRVTKITESSTQTKIQKTSLKQGQAIDPPTPTGLSTVEVTQNLITIKWDAISSPSVKYVVYRDGTRVQQEYAQTEYTDIGLSPQTKYVYEVSARLLTIGREGNKSAPLNVTTQAVPDTTRPRISSKHLNLTAGAARFTWRTDENATGAVYYGETEDLGEEETEDNLSTQHTITITLSNETESDYFYILNSCDESGNCINTTKDHFTPFDQTIPTINATVPSVVGIAAIRISGTTEPGSNISIKINRERLPRRKAYVPDGNFSFNMAIPYPTEIDPPPEYTLLIQARDRGGNKANATYTFLVDLTRPSVRVEPLPSHVHNNTITVKGTTTKDIEMQFYLEAQGENITKPGKVTGLNATAEENLVTLNWNAVNNSDRYVVYRNDVGPLYTTPGTDYADDQASNGTRYTYRVSAFTFSKEGEKSNPVTARTPTNGTTLPTPQPIDITQAVPIANSSIGAGNFSQEVTLQPGKNIIRIKAVDNADHKFSWEDTVKYIEPSNDTEEDFMDLLIKYLPLILSYLTKNRNLNINTGRNTSGGLNAGTIPGNNGNNINNNQQIPIEELDKGIDKILQGQATDPQSQALKDRLQEIKESGNQAKMLEELQNLMDSASQGKNNEYWEEKIEGCDEGDYFSISVTDVAPQYISRDQLRKGEYVGYFITSINGHDEATITNVKAEAVQIENHGTLQNILDRTSGVFGPKKRDWHFYMYLKPYSGEMPNTLRIPMRLIIDYNNGTEDKRQIKCGIIQAEVLTDETAKQTIQNSLDDTKNSLNNAIANLNEINQEITSAIEIAKEECNNKQTEFINLHNEAIAQCDETEKTLITTLTTEIAAGVIKGSVSQDKITLRNALVENPGIINKTARYALYIKDLKNSKGEYCQEAITANSEINTANTELPKVVEICKTCEIEIEKARKAENDMNEVCDRIFCPSIPSLRAFAGHKTGSKDETNEGWNDTETNIEGPYEQNSKIDPKVPQELKKQNPWLGQTTEAELKSYRNTCYFYNKTTEENEINNACKTEYIQKWQSACQGVDIWKEATEERTEEEQQPFCQKETQTEQEKTYCGQDQSSSSCYIIKTGEDISICGIKIEGSTNAIEPEMLTDEINSKCDFTGVTNEDKEAFDFTISTKVMSEVLQSAATNNANNCEWESVKTLIEKDSWDSLKMKEKCDEYKKLPTYVQQKVLEKLQNESVYIIHPSSSLARSMQCVCLPSTKVYLKQWETILQKTKKCFEDIEKTGEGHPINCQIMVSQLTCDIGYEYYCQNNDVGEIRDRPKPIATNEAEEATQISVQGMQGEAADSNTLINPECNDHFTTKPTFGKDFYKAEETLSGFLNS